ncbi:MAG: phage holin family protein [Loktanella sp.]|nr:phage holin family protein [Loktanella sp.]
MAGLVHDLQDRARLAARAAAFTVVGVVFALTGLGFLTVALWLALAEYENALMASAVVGVVYLVLGTVFFLIAGSRRARSVTPSQQAAPPPMAGDYEPFLRMAEAFSVGMAAGRAARRPRR